MLYFVYLCPCLRLGVLIVCDAMRNLVPFAQFKKRENTHGRVLLSVKLQPKACNFTKSNTPPWVFFTLLK